MSRMGQRQPLGVLFLFSLAVGVSACAPRTEFVDLQAQVAQLTEQQARRAASVESVKRQLAATQQAQIKISLLQAETGDMIRQVAGHLEELHAIFAELGQTGEVDRLRVAQLKDRIEVLERRAARPGGTSATERLPALSRKVLRTPTDAYRVAYEDYLRGQYDLALQGFQRYIDLAPKGPLAANAQYWMGESYLGKQEPHAALKAFARVVDGYPDRDVVPSALLKTGATYWDLGEREKGQEWFKRLVEDFPRTPEARLAQARLDEEP